MKILVAVEDLRVGGAQTFALRLAQALHRAGHTVHLYNHYAHLVNQELIQALAPDVPIISAGENNSWVDWALRKADGMSRRLKTKSLREQQVVRHLRAVVQHLKPDVVNSHTIKADYAAAKALQGMNIPLIITMHGCYELFLHKVGAADVTAKGIYALQHTAGLIYLTEKNLEIFDEPEVHPLSSTLLHQQIYNGFDGKFSSQKAAHSRAALNIPSDGIVFGMVARGIPEKGWGYAVRSFEELQAEFPRLHLILVGQSDYLAELRVAHPHERIHFTGFSRNPIDWIDIFDVGLLPSYFHAESLPNSIAEYLACSKPVIASRIGEVPNMLESADGLAGILIDQNNGKLTDPAQLTEAMRLYLTEPQQLVTHQRRATLAFEKFRMPHCISAYEAVFQQAKLEGNLHS